MPEAVQRALTITTPPDDVDTVHDLLESIWAEAPNISIKDRFCFETALIELAANVIQHADDGSGVVCRLEIGVYADHVDAVLRDSGRAVSVQLEGREMPDEMAESGRGIPLIQALVDIEYLHANDFNEWRISRRLNA